MNLYWNYLKYLFVMIPFLWVSCSDDDTSQPDLGGFDRSLMLQFWSDSIILPRLESYYSSCYDMYLASLSLEDGTDRTEWDEFLNLYEAAYLQWQGVSMIELGPAETVALRNRTNIFPVDTSKLNDALNAGQYNFELPSTYSIQGFPALDYLLFSDDKDLTIERVATDRNFTKYIIDLTASIEQLSKQVNDDWKSYSVSFVENDGSSATASVDKMVNDYLFYYEKFLRAGKIGIPAGVFTGTASPDRVEAYYGGYLSKALLSKALEDTQHFFQGKSELDNRYGPSIQTYLDAVLSNTNNENLSDRIINNWKEARSMLDQMPDDLSMVVMEDNARLLKLYDKVQENVILMKTEMLQAMNIQVDYVDADGD